MEDCDYCVHGHWKKITNGNQWEPPEWDFTCDLDCQTSLASMCGNFVWDCNK